VRVIVRMSSRCLPVWTVVLGLASSDFCVSASDTSANERIHAARRAVAEQERQILDDLPSQDRGAFSRRIQEVLSSLGQDVAATERLAASLMCHREWAALRREPFNNAVTTQLASLADRLEQSLRAAFPQLPVSRMEFRDLAQGKFGQWRTTLDRREPTLSLFFRVPLAESQLDELNGRIRTRCAEL
jgi:hypothetical protein